VAILPITRLLRRASFLGGLVALPALAGPTSGVVIFDYEFAPAHVRIRPGDLVRWVNQEKRTSHSILFTVDSPAFGGTESPRLFPGETWELKFELPGRYGYRCGPHNEMQGSVEVSELAD
jgi:plastocyanin